MAGFTVAPACAAALREATVRWPHRNRASDGTIGDTAHSARSSDHNPDERGMVLAFDLTNDPAHGCDAHALVEQAVARRDPRIKYAISQGRIWSALREDEGWRSYSGSNPHDKHAHVSVHRSHENDTSPWWAPQEEDELTADEKQMLKEVHAMLKAIGAPRRSDRKDPDPMRISLADCYTISEKAYVEAKKAAAK